MSVALFFSGQGSTLQAALDVLENVKLGVCDRKKAGGLARLRRRGIPVLQSKNWEEILFEVQRRRIRLIFLLGFMRIVPAEFLQSFHGRVLNVHPSLLPKHPGLHGMEKSLQAGDPVAASVHHVVPEVDAGPLVFQRPATAPGFAGDVRAARRWLARTEQHLIRETLCKVW